VPMGTEFLLPNKVIIKVCVKVTEWRFIRSNMLEGEQNYIKQAKRGDKEAFAELYRHYLPKIYRFVFLKVNNKTEAEDLTHEVFLNTWQNLNSYTPTEFPFSSWLYRIARNEVIDFYRTDKKNVRLDLVDEDFLKMPETESQDLDLVLSLESVKNLIQFLRPEQQDVLIMRFIEDLSHKEIANALNKSEGAIRLLQHRAINELKKIAEKNVGNTNQNITEA